MFESKNLDMGHEESLCSLGQEKIDLAGFKLCNTNILDTWESRVLQSPHQGSTTSFLFCHKYYELGPICHNFSGSLCCLPERKRWFN